MPDQLHFSNGDDEAASAILAIAAEGLIDVPDATRQVIIVADRTYRAQRVAGETHARLTGIDALSLGRDAAIAAARKGEDADAIAAAADATAEHEAAIARARTRLEALKLAGSVSSGAAMVAMRTGVPSWGTQLADALEHLLEQASGDARIMADAGDFDYSDPMAVHAADRPVQQAFGRLKPLAAQHDRIRAGVVLLVKLDASWPDVNTFEGHGIALWQFNSQSPRVWRFEPTGHPVARLVVAALAVEPTVVAAA